MGDIADDIFNRYVDDGFWFSGRRSEPPPTVCKQCGSHAVFWQLVKGQYKLFSRNTLTEHVCDPDAVAKHLADDFEDLDE